MVQKDNIINKTERKPNLFVSHGTARSDAASSSSCVASDGGVKYPARRWPLSRKAILPKRNDCRKLARALPTTLIVRMSIPKIKRKFLRKLNNKLKINFKNKNNKNPFNKLNVICNIKICLSLFVVE